MDCSKCGKPSAHSVLVRKGNPGANVPGDKDRRGVYVVPFCEDHWRELEKFLKS